MVDNNDLKIGDTVYFSSVAVLVNEGTVEFIQGSYIKIKTKCPGIDYIMKDEAFTTKEELRRSKSYSNAWTSNQRLNAPTTYMGDMTIF